MLLPMPGALFTSLAPPGGGPAIRVYVYPGHGPPSDNVLPDVRCHAVRIGSLRGRRRTALISASPVCARPEYHADRKAGPQRCVAVPLLVPPAARSDGRNRAQTAALPRSVLG
jgi:hypothetical protein